MKYEKDNLKKSIIRAYSIEENLLHVDMVARATPHAHYSLLLFVGGTIMDIIVWQKVKNTEKIPLPLYQC